MTEPTYTHFTQHDGQSLLACDICGAAVPPTRSGQHSAWHMAHRDLITVLASVIEASSGADAETKTAALVSLEEIRKEL